MATVFPWTSGSTALALGLLAALLTLTLLLAYARQLARRGLEALVLADPHAPFFRRGRFLRRAKQTAGWAVGVIAAFAGAYASTWVWAPFSTMVWEPLLARAAPALIIIATVLVANLAIEAVRDIPDRARQLAAWRGRKVNSQLLHASELFLRYVIIAGAVALIGASLLELIGLQGRVGANILAWVTSQAGSLALVASLIAIGWIGGRLIRAVASEIRSTTKRVSPQVVDALGATVRGALYAVLGLIGVFTILQSVGLGDVGGTLVIVMSSFIGLTVAMAGTGSIGNALSGMVLMGMRPMEKGDRVVLADDITCDIDEVTLMFTRAKTLAGEVIEIPNNQVLLRPIRNLTRSAAHAIVVKLGIGYDTSHELVRSLAVTAAGKTEGILKDPAPELFSRRFANYAIEYELYAYTQDPRHLKTRSALLGHLQEAFYAAGVEIMTPDVMIMRKGKTAEEEGFVRVQVTAPRNTDTDDAPAAERAPDPQERNR